MRSPNVGYSHRGRQLAESTIARGLLPELMRRLVLATVDRANLQVISFPAREEVQRHGYDGTTSTDIKTTHVPQGNRSRRPRWRTCNCGRNHISRRRLLV